MRIKTFKEPAFKEGIFLIIITLFWFSQYVYIPHQINYLNSLGQGNYSVGLIIGAYGVSQLLLRFPIGILADYLGKHKIFIMLGCLSAATASFFRILWQNEAGFLIGNLFSGIASSMWISFMVFYINSFKSEKQQVATSRIILFNNLGMLTGFICSMLGYSLIKMKGICQLSFLGGFIAFILSVFIHESGENKEIASNKDIRDLLEVCKNKRVLIFSILALIQQGIQLATAMSFTNQILKNMGMNDQIIGLSSVIYMSSAVVFSLFSTTDLCRKKSPKFWIVMILLVISTYTILIPIVQNIIMIFMLQILLGMSTGILFSYITSEAMKEIPKNKRSTAMGFFQTIYAIGMTLFPIMVGNITNNYSIKTAYFILSFIAVLGCLMILIYYKIENSQMTRVSIKN